MITIGSENKVVSCPNDHQNPEGSEWCDTCGLPIIDYEAELDLLLKALAEEERHVTFPKENIFLGIGDQGCKLIDDFYRSWGRSIKGSAYLMINSSGDTEEYSATYPHLNSGQKYTSPPPSLHFFTTSTNRQAGYYGLGEHLASNDTTLNDRLRRSGIKSSTRKQTIFLLSALGGGTGSGASPHTLRRIKSINPNSRSLVTALMPAADEPDSAHFNAYCSLSRFIKGNHGALADMILLVDQDRLMKIRGVGSGGEEIAREAVISYLEAMLTGAITNGSPNQADPGYLAKMSRSMGIHAFVPCMAIGRSMEIFGDMANILESALSCPLAEVDKESVILSYLLVQVPDRLASSLHEETLRAELNKWNRDTFPRLKGSVLQLTLSSRTADRVDVCLLLGGTRLATTTKMVKRGFDRFKAIVGTKDWEQEFGVTSKIVPEVEHAINGYDAKLDEITD